MPMDKKEVDYYSSPGQGWARPHMFKATHRAGVRPHVLAHVVWPCPCHGPNVPGLSGPRPPCSPPVRFVLSSTLRFALRKRTVGCWRPGHKVGIRSLRSPFLCPGLRYASPGRGLEKRRPFSLQTGSIAALDHPSKPSEASQRRWPAPQRLPGGQPAPRLTNQKTLVNRVPG